MVLKEVSIVVFLTPVLSQSLHFWCHEKHDCWKIFCTTLFDLGMNCLKSKYFCTVHFEYVVCHMYGCALSTISNEYFWITFLIALLFLEAVNSTGTWPFSFCQLFSSVPPVFKREECASHRLCVEDVCCGHQGPASKQTEVTVLCVCVCVSNRYQSGSAFSCPRLDGHLLPTIWLSCSHNSSIRLRSDDYAGDSIVDRIPAHCFFPEFGTVPWAIILLLQWNAVDRVWHGVDKRSAFLIQDLFDPV